MLMYWMTSTRNTNDNSTIPLKTRSAQSNIFLNVSVCRMQRPSTSKTVLCISRRSLRLPTKLRTLRQLPPSPLAQCPHPPSPLLSQRLCHPSPFLEQRSCQRKSRPKHSVNQSWFYKNNSRTANKRLRSSKPLSLL